MSFPNTIYFCNKTKEGSERYLTNWKRLNPSYEMQVYDDNMCREFIIKHYGNFYGELFDFLQDGPIKADFWRLCLLYKLGGIYSDVDNVPLVSLDSFIDKSADFLTCSAYMNEPRGTFSFNPNLIMARKGEPILKKCIEWYVSRYKNRIPYNYWQWSVMRAFTDTLVLENYDKKEGLYNYEGRVVQILEERPGDDFYDAHNVYKGVRIFNNRSPDWNWDTHSFISPKEPAASEVKPRKSKMIFLIIMGVLIASCVGILVYTGGWEKLWRLLPHRDSNPGRLGESQLS